MDKFYRYGKGFVDRAEAQDFERQERLYTSEEVQEYHDRWKHTLQLLYAKYPDVRGTRGALIEVSLKQVLDKIFQKPIAVISAFKDRDEEGNEILLHANLMRSRELEQELKRLGYHVVVIGGVWKGNHDYDYQVEKSFLVISDFPADRLLRDITRLAKKYNQDAFIFGDGEDIVLYVRKGSGYALVQKLGGYDVMSLTRAIEKMKNAEIGGRKKTYKLLGYMERKFRTSGTGFNTLLAMGHYKFLLTPLEKLFEGM